MMRIKKTEKNYMDYIPMKTEKFNWSVNNKNRVVVDVVNNGFYNKIAQKFFKTPKISHIELDEYGSFIWNLIDGNNSVFAISKVIKDKYGTKAEPLYNRLIKFFQILEQQKFISFKGKC